MLITERSSDVSEIWCDFSNALRYHSGFVGGRVRTTKHGSSCNGFHVDMIAAADISDVSV